MFINSTNIYSLQCSRLHWDTEDRHISEQSKTMFALMEFTFYWGKMDTKQCTSRVCQKAISTAGKKQL